MWPVANFTPMTGATLGEADVTHLLYLQGLQEWVEQLLSNTLLFRTHLWVTAYRLYRKTRLLMLRVIPLRVYLCLCKGLTQMGGGVRLTACMSWCVFGWGLIRLHFTPLGNPSWRSKAYFAAWWLVFSLNISMFWLLSNRLAILLWSNSIIHKRGKVVSDAFQSQPPLSQNIRSDFSFIDSRIYRIESGQLFKSLVEFRTRTASSRLVSSSKRNLDSAPNLQRITSVNHPSAPQSTTSSSSYTSTGNRKS